MKAVQISQYGESDVAKINENVSEPLLKEGQILVEVHAASINPFDAKIRSGLYKDSMPMQFPYIPGGDFAGTVIKLGENVSQFKEGDAVFGSALILNGGSGAFAKICAANTKNSAHKPKNIDFISASSLPLVGSSAIQGLEEHIKLQKNQKILIHGGAGGIGSIAVQLAKYLGAYVATTVSGDDKDFVKNLGADQVIDYKTKKFEEILSDFDAVFDTVGGETTDRSFKILKKGLPAGRQGGILVSMLGQPNEELARQYGVTAIGQGTQTDNRHLSRLGELVEKSVIKPQVDKVFPLEKTKEAFDYLEKDSPKGKVVLEIK